LKKNFGQIIREPEHRSGFIRPDPNIFMLQEINHQTAWKKISDVYPTFVLGMSLD